MLEIPVEINVFGLTHVHIWCKPITDLPLDVEGALIYFCENASKAGLQAHLDGLQNPELAPQELTEGKIFNDLVPDKNLADAREWFQTTKDTVNAHFSRLVGPTVYKLGFPQGILIRKGNGHVLSPNIDLKMDVLTFETAFALASLPKNENNPILWKAVLDAWDGKLSYMDFSDYYDDPSYVNQRQFELTDMLKTARLAYQALTGEKV